MGVIWVTGWPKTGTTWVCRLLGDALDSPVGAIAPGSTSRAVATEGQGRSGGHYIGQGHVVPFHQNETIPKAKIHRLIVEDLVDEKLVLVLRDPRDTCVSGSYHWGRPVNEFIELAARGLWPVPHGGGFVPFYRKWFGSGLDYCLIRYEALYKDTAGELQRILDEIGISPARDVYEVAHRQSFAERRKWTKKHGHGLNYGAEWQTAFLRKGIIGDWKNHFGEAEIELCEHHFGEFMDEVGYQR